MVAVEASQTRAQALYPSVRYDQVQAFTYIRNLATQRNLLVVNPALPIGSVAEFIAYTRAPAPGRSPMAAPWARLRISAARSSRGRMAWT